MSRLQGRSAAPPPVASSRSSHWPASQSWRPCRRGAKPATAAQDGRAVHAAGPRADVEPARRVRRCGVGRPTGVHGARRLLDGLPGQRARQGSVLLRSDLGAHRRACSRFPLGFVAFRLRGSYFAIGTWVLAEVASKVIITRKSLGAGDGVSLKVAGYSPAVAPGCDLLAGDGRGSRFGAVGIPRPAVATRSADAGDSRRRRRRSWPWRQRVPHPFRDLDRRRVLDRVRGCAVLPPAVAGAAGRHGGASVWCCGRRRSSSSSSSAGSARSRDRSSAPCCTTSCANFQDHQTVYLIGSGVAAMVVALWAAAGAVGQGPQVDRRRPVSPSPKARAPSPKDRIARRTMS